jgi:hypothetical protein
VIDNHSQRTDSGRRFPVTVRLVTRLVLVFIACSWLFLYLDSVHQRRRAESLIADLKSLDFATAGFTDVRDLVIRNGGYASPGPGSLERPDFPTPSMPDLHGNISFYKVWPPCTRQDCTFIVWITTRLARLPFPVEKRTVEVLYSALPYIGVRSWGLGALFVVRNGKLERSQIFIAERRIDRLEPDYPLEVIPLGYEVETVLIDSACRGGHQGVSLSHGHPVRMPQKMLHSCVLQTERKSTKRAFDMNLRCLNGIVRGCRFGELAPSAWADYSAKDGGTGTSVPYK